MKKLLLAAAGTVAATALSGANMLTGDTSFETEPDTLTSGNLDYGALPFAWDDKEAFHGRRSMRVDWDQKNRFNIFLKAHDNWIDNHICLTTPDLENGKTYTFSFYAKAEHDKAPLGIWLNPGAGWEFWPKKSNYYHTFYLTREWKRYSFSFIPVLAGKAPLKSYNCMFAFKKAKPGKFWIDAVQFEPGAQATPYQPPAPMSCGVRMNVPAGQGDLRTTCWAVYYAGKDPVSGTVRVVSNDGKGGKLTVRTIDWQGKAVSEFTRDVKGGETIPLKFDPNRRGWFKTLALITRDGKEIVRHSANYMMIDSPVKTAPGIEPYFGILGSSFQLPLMQRVGSKRMQIAQPWRNAHTGGFEPVKGKFDFRFMDRQFELAEKYGMKVKLLFSGNQTPLWYFDPKLVAEAKKYPHAVDFLYTKESVEGWKKAVTMIIDRYGSRAHTLELGGEDNGRLGSNSYYRAKHPEWLVNNWVVRGEPFELFYDANAEIARMAKQKFPKLKISVVRPSEGREGDDWVFVRSVFERIGKSFDTFGIDTYLLNPFDVGPDIQSHSGSIDGREWTWNLLQNFIKNYGCGQDIFMSEASLACDARYPDESPWQRQRAELMAKDLLICRALGFYAYDMFIPLSTTVVGKYAWGMMQNHRVQMGLPAVCQTARLVENTVKARYIRLPGAARITLFEKHDGSGAAAIWADKGYFFQPAKAGALTVMDIMGNAVKPGRNGRYDLSVFPVLITDAKYKEMENAILKGEIGESSFCRLFWDVRRENQLTMRLENTSTKRDLRMVAEVVSEAGKHSRELSIAPGASRTITLPAKGKKAEITFRRTDTNAVDRHTVDLPNLIPIKRDPAQIAEIVERYHILPGDPWVTWTGPSDLSARFFASWDDKYLKIEVQATDDRHFANQLSAWNCDSVQIALDPKSNAGLQNLSPGVLGSDDVEFCLAAVPAGKKIRGVSAGRKDLWDECVATRDETGKRTLYKFLIPWEKLQIKPEPGVVFGMSFVLFDDDAGNGPEYLAPVGGGIAKKKDPRKYLKFILK